MIAHLFGTTVFCRPQRLWYTTMAHPDYQCRPEVKKERGKERERKKRDRGGKQKERLNDNATKR